MYIRKEKKRNVYTADKPKETIFLCRTLYHVGEPESCSSIYVFTWCSFAYRCYHHIRWFFGYMPSLPCVSKKFHFGLFEESVTHKYGIVDFTSFTHRASRAKQK